MKYPARSFAITSRRFSSRIATNPKVSVRSRSSCLPAADTHRIRNAIKFLADPRLAHLLTPLYLIGRTSQCSRHDNYRLSYNSCGRHDLLPHSIWTSLASSSIVVSQIVRFCMPGQLSLTDRRNRIRATSTNICTLLHLPEMLEVFGDRPLVAEDRGANPVTFGTPGRHGAGDLPAPDLVQMCAKLTKVD